MKVKVNQFCNLATTPSWQSWLYNYNQNLYHEFISKLAKSHGCNYNKDLMVSLLQKINDIGGGDQLLSYLDRDHPNMIIKKQSRAINNDIFPNYKPGLLTYPKRIIIEESSKSELVKKTNNFVSNKLKYDYIILDHKAYIEYLTHSDVSVQNQISSDNWLIAKWRLRTKK